MPFWCLSKRRNSFRISLRNYHADSDVARIALYWKRHLDDVQTAEQSLAGLNTKDRNDATFMRRLPTLYLLRCHQDNYIGERLLQYTSEFLASANTVVRWHAESVAAELSGWVK